MRMLTSIVLFAVAAAIAAPPPVEAQDITRKMKVTAKQRLKARTAKTEENILQQTGAAVDSAVSPGAERVDSMVSAAGGAAAGLPRLLGEAVGAGGESRRIREALNNSGRAVLPGIAFVTGSAQLDPSAEAHLMALAEAIVDLGGAFLIESHVEPGGKSNQAKTLSQARAAAVKAWLVADGVPEADLFVASVGPARPDERGVRTARVEVARIQ